MPSSRRSAARRRRAFVRCAGRPAQSRARPRVDAGAGEIVPGARVAKLSQMEEGDEDRQVQHYMHACMHAYIHTYIHTYMATEAPKS